MAQSQTTSTNLIQNTLKSVTASSVNLNEDLVVAKLSTQSSKYVITDNDTNRPSISFEFTKSAPNIQIPQRLKGNLKSISIDQIDSSLTINFRTAKQSKLNAVFMSDGSLNINIKTSDTNNINSPTKAPLPQQKLSSELDNGFEVIHLKFADVSEVVGLLNGTLIKSNDTFVPKEPAFGSAGMTGNNFNPVQFQSPENMNPSLGQSIDENIAVDRRLNAIILKGSPEKIAQLKEKIAAIDVPVDSVVLETIFVELTDNAAKAIGLDLNNANGQIAVGTFQSGAYRPNTTYPIESPGVRSLALQGAIYAQVTTGNGRIVSKPKISALSGSTAKIITGDALPILTAITLSGVNAVSQQVQYVNVGVTLQIMPRVSKDGFVTSHVFCVVSSVTGYSQGYPTISQRQADTVASVADGESYIIGGLTQENDLSTDSKIPLLGDIPLLGSLFHFNKGNKSNTQLYIVVTPRIVKRGQESFDIKSIESESRKTIESK